MEKFKTRAEAQEVIEMCSYFNSVMNDFKECLSKYDLLDYARDYFDRLYMLSDALAMEAFIGKSRISAANFHNLCNKLFENHDGNK